MKNFFKNGKYILILGDIIIIPALFFCKWFSQFLLDLPGDCIWTLMGGQCITCGGTHFVNALLKGQFADAFFHNQLLFICAAVLLISYILLHLWYFGKMSFAQKTLRAIYSIPGLIVFCCGIIAFLLIRNIGLIQKVSDLLW